MYRNGFRSPFVTTYVRRACSCFRSNRVGFVSMREVPISERRLWRPRLEFPKPRVVNQMSHVLYGEDLPPRREDELFHVLSPNLESPPGDARNDFESRL